MGKESKGAHLKVTFIPGPNNSAEMEPCKAPREELPWVEARGMLQRYKACVDHDDQRSEYIAIANLRQFVKDGTLKNGSRRDESGYYRSSTLNCLKESGTSNHEQQ
ncbi:unnamed protein product [Caretta caretta]